MSTPQTPNASDIKEPIEVKSNEDWERDVEYYRKLAESHCPSEMLTKNERLNWIEGALNMAHHFYFGTPPSQSTPTLTIIKQKITTKNKQV